MNNRIWVIILVLICVGLGVSVITVRNKAAEKQHQDAELIGTYSNKWVKTSSDLDEEQRVRVMVEKDLETQKKSFGELTNQFSDISTDLAKTEASLKTSQEELVKRDARITDLENQNQALDNKAKDLTLAITNLSTQIAATQRKLSASEGDRAFLEKELKRMMAEKGELERQFSDLTVLRAQVAKIKEDIVIARRQEWIRQGFYANADQKGAQKLIQAVNPPPPRPAKTNYDLNVEVSADGSVKVIPPATNSPAGGSSPPK
jgi:chromosome segregation ATPase